jgi:hypothetical protein
MNIFELNNIISQLEKSKDLTEKPLLKFYRKKRKELTTQISKEINSKLSIN